VKTATQACAHAQPVHLLKVHHLLEHRVLHLSTKRTDLEDTSRRWSAVVAGFFAPCPVFRDDLGHYRGQHRAASLGVGFLQGQLRGGCYHRVRWDQHSLPVHHCDHEVLRLLWRRLLRTVRGWFRHGSGVSSCAGGARIRNYSAITDRNSFVKGQHQPQHQQTGSSTPADFLNTSRFDPLQLGR
jgi:hypothetical protein